MKKTTPDNLVKLSKQFLFRILTPLCVVCLFNATKAQTVLYSTDFGAVANVNPAGWTFTGVGMNISTNGGSSGYTGVSGGAYLGEGNSTNFINTSGASQVSSPVGYSDATLLMSTTGYSNIVLSFGMRKSSGSYNANATYTLEWSTNGSSYTPIVYTEATAGAWGLVSGSGLALPSGADNQATLYLRWSFTRTGTGSNYKMDDLIVTGGITSVTPATISFLSNDTTVNESVASANFYVRLTSTSTASSAVTISVSALSNASAADYTISALTLTFAANAPVNSTYPVNITLNNDATVESSEYVVLRMGNLQNANVGTINQFAFYIADNDKIIPSPSNALSLNLLSSFSNTVSGANSAEIVAHDPTTQRLYIANSIGAKLDIVDFVNPSNPTLIYSIPVTTYGNINCVAVYNGTVAAAIENINPQDSGKVVFFNPDGVFISQVKVGMMPDMITFNHAGTRVLTANEGEPNAAYTNDPDGSVSIINISGGVAALTQTNVAHATFTAYNGQEAALRAQGIRIYGLNANAAKDIEPEYIAISKDDSKAWITLQENNAVAEVNLITNSVVAIRPLGTKDHSLLNNGLDASNVTRSVNISNFPIKGLYLPDAIATYTVGGVNYIITANEGDSRAYSGFSEEQRISSVNLDPARFPLAAQLKNNYFLGRLNVTDKSGDTDNDGDLDTLYSYGTRSFSIWNAATGVQVYDSKDDLEMITSTNSYSVLFNASNTNNTKKDRSDDKGPEPEGVTIGTIGLNTYAFIALERIGGVMVYDVTNPAAPVYVTYVNNRILPGGGPDNGSEGIIFIPQSQSPNGQHLVIAANEVSSTLSIWGIAGCATPISSSLSVSGPTSNICSNNTPTLTVAANSNLTYQWSRNGVVIPGATSNTVAAGLTGSYSVAIVGPANCSTGSLLRTFSVNATPTLAITGSSVLCLGASVTQTVSGASTYSWSNGPTTNTVSFAPTTSTVYAVTGTGTNNCTASVNTSITVNANPTVTINGGSVSICNGAAITLTVSGANTYSWASGPTNSVVTFTPGASIVYSVTGTNTNNCSGSVSTSITVNANPVVNVIGTPATICQGATALLALSGANSYSWSTGPTTNTLNVSPLTTTIYSATGTGTNNCVTTSTILIFVNPTPTVGINGGSISICSGASAVLTATGASTYNWNNGLTTAPITVTPQLTTSYTVTGAGANGCSATAVTQVSVNSLPAVTINPSTVQVCNGNSVTLTASGATSYTWNTPANTAVINVTPATTNSTYIVSGTGTNNCVNSATQTINILALPVLNINSSSATICSGENATLTISGAGTYIWNGGSQAAQLVVNPTTNTTYSVTGTAANNCSAIAQITQTVSVCTSVNALNRYGFEYVMYPNPAKTEVAVRFEENTKVDIRIFNALGALLLEQQDYTSGTVIGIESLNKGIYFIALTKGRDTVQKKLVVE